MFNLKEAAEYGVQKGTNFTSHTITEMGFEGRVVGQGQTDERWSRDIELDERVSGATSETAA